MKPVYSGRTQSINDQAIVPSIIRIPGQALLNNRVLKLQNQANDRNDVCFHAGEFTAYLLLPVNTMDFEAKECLTCSSKTLVSQACVTCVFGLKTAYLGLVWTEI